MKKLAKGDVIAASGATMKMPRGLEVETMFILPMPVAKANDAQQKWDGTRHPELKIYLHVDLPRRPALASLQCLSFFRLRRHLSQPSPFQPSPMPL